jgi:hypothetical protein
MIRKLYILFFLCARFFSIVTCQSQNFSDKIIEQAKYKLYFDSQGNFYNSNWTFPDTCFIFLEIMEFQSAEIISRNSDITNLPNENIDFPMYSYDVSLHILKTWDKNFISEKEKLKMILGKGIWLGENIGSGGATSLFSVYSFPSYEDETAIYEVDSLGTIFFRHENMFHKLKINETLSDTSFNIKTFEGKQGCKLRVARIIRFTNYGLINKTDLINTSNQN